jgi:predicted NUDIX family phosphoesterase
MENAHSEHVLVIPTEKFRELGYFQGFCDDVDRYRATLFDPRYTSYRPRHEVEQDPGFKQLIPYVIFRSGRADPLLFQYQRGQGQAEARLHRLRSVGIGGHISSADSTNGQPYEVGMRRELEEEVEIGAAYREQCVGLINDDSNTVGQVHLGIVHVFDVESPRIAPREADLVDAGFRRLTELVREIDQFETWSQICLHWLAGTPSLERAAPAR